MKTQRKLSSNKKILIAASTITACLAIGGLIFTYKSLPDNTSPVQTDISSNNTQESKPNDVNLNPPSKEEEQAGEDAKRETVAPDTPSPSNTIPIIVTVASYYPEEGMVKFRMLVSEVLSGATCNLSVSSGGQNLSLTVNTQVQAGNTTCQGFDVPSGQLPAGEWQAAITVKTSTRQGSAEAKVKV